MVPALTPAVERWVPFGRLAPRTVYTVPPENVRPAIHLAHEWDAIPNIANRRIIIDHEFVMTVGGGGVVDMNGERFEFGEYELLYIKPFIPHSMVPAAGATGRHLAVHFDWAAGVPRKGDPRVRTPYEVRLAEGLEVPARFALSAGHRVEREFHNLVRAWGSGEPLGKLEATVALSNMIVWLLRHSAEAAKKSPSTARDRHRVDAVIAYAKAHLTRPLPADELAMVAGVSRSRLTSLFRSVTGYAPLEFIRSMRVDEAKRLLGDVNLPVKEIAARTGFADVYHFSHAFNRVVGIPATQYRQMLLSGREGR